MAKDKEFSFDEDGDDFSFEPEKLPKPKKPAGGGGGQKRLLLLLLVIVAGAAAYVYLYGMPGSTPGPQPAPATPPKVAVKPPAQPAKPAQPVTAQPAPPAAAQPAAAKPAPQPVAVKPGPTTAQPVPAQPAQPAAAQPVATKPAAQPVAVPSAKPAAAQPVAPQPVVAKPLEPAVEGKYRLSAGAFTVKRNLLDTEKRLRKLGYEPQRTTVKRPVAMTRLRVGRFAPHEAAARLADLQRKYPEAFTMKSGEKVALYVGSYQNINLARSFADRLFLDDGIHVDEESVTVKVPMTVVHFGAFADRDAAETAARQARAAGLDDISIVAKR